MTKKKIINNNAIITLDSCFQKVQREITQILLTYYKVNSKFNDSIKYNIINNGKKFRPFLLWASGIALGADEKTCLHVGAILEILHTYSLIHDDLPSMDNGSKRHGKPSAHKEYGESIAILTGDALLTDAFAFLSNKEIIKESNIALEVINVIATYLGSQGMVLGQALEMFSHNKRLTIDEIKHIHYLKTAKFMEMSILVGGILAQKHEVKEPLTLFGKNIGIVFQIQDDIEDFASDSDSINICNFTPKSTIKKDISRLIKEAIDALKATPYNFEILISFAQYLASKNG